jgi:[ribosomal protein S18]-alanine N-acetyltransferase
MTTSDHAKKQAMRFVVRQLTSTDAELISQWQYDGPWSVYSSRPGGAPLRAGDGYFAVEQAETGALVGYGCFGAEARVPGLTEEPGIVDVDVGMAPAMVGRGFGRAFAGAVLSHILATTEARQLRAVVQSWNERSLRLTRGLGFAEVGVHTCVQGGRSVEYIVLLRGASDPTE